jgi:hypothetical protein
MKGLAMHTQNQNLPPCTQAIRWGSVNPRGPKIPQQKGAVTLLVALTLPILVGAAALAVDMAY